MEILDYREVMEARRWQAQFKCPSCGNWILTSNLEVYKDDDGNKVAEAVDTMCKTKTSGQMPCGEQLGTVTFPNWKYSTPVVWKKPEVASVVTD